MKLRGLSWDGILSYFDISREPLTKEDWSRIEKQKRQAAQLKKRENLERDIAFTLAFLIRSAHTAMKQITKNNLEEYGETLNLLPWWEYCHEILCSGSDDQKRRCCEELKDMPIIKRNTAFKPGFDLGQWSREVLNG